ncbi:MAG: YaaR family protein [Firmicutes bacterium]|nr:YaaR family protein [Bacillota bacterium]
MKISSGRSRRSAGSGGAPERARQKRVGQTGATFIESLHKAERDHLRRSLDELIPLLDQAAADLLNTRTLRNFNRYRDLVREFLDHVMRETNQVREISGFSGGRLKIMVVVQKVNAALEEMAREVLAAHAEGLRLLQLVDEIRGLLLDLYT